MLNWFNGRNADDAKVRDALGAMGALNKVQAVIWFDLEGNILDANENFLGAMGYSLSDIVGKHHRLFVAPEYAQSIEYAEFWRKLGRGETHSGEYKRFARGGKEVWIEASYNPVLDADGKPVKIVKFAIDVTAQKIRNADASGQLDAISKSQAVIEFELDGTIRTANENFVNAVGYSLQEIVGQHHRIFVDPVEASKAEYADFWRKLAAGEFQSAEYRRLGKGGKEIWIQASYNPIFDQNGKPFKVVKYATDITARKHAMQALDTALNSLAEGDLQARIDPSVNGEFTQLRDAFNATMQRLQEMVGGIKSASHNIAAATGTISRGSEDLASRAENQASSLEETAATMEEMTATIKANADSTAQASQAANDAQERAERGGEVVSNAIDAMQNIETSAAKISEINSVIDSIAFQTNLLALNAAVEAARAGDAGKGFAVVASEVRTLAQRSSEAAKDITALIQESTGYVSAGADLVRQTGSALSDIDSAVKSVVSNISEIASASREQSSSAEEISSVVSHLDQATQQNSALAAESASNAKALTSEADSLRNLVAFFRDGDTEAVADTSWRQVSAAAAPQPVETPRQSPAPLKVVGGGDWSDF